jgi:hypothetical protein
MKVFFESTFILSIGEGAVNSKGCKSAIPNLAVFLKNESHSPSKE